MSRNLNSTRWDSLINGLEQSVLDSTDHELLQGAGALAHVDKVRQLIRSGINTSLKPKAAAARPGLPRKPEARRELLRLLLGSQRAAPTLLAASFSAGEDLSDADVEEALRRLLPGER